MAVRIKPKSADTYHDTSTPGSPIRVKKLAVQTGSGTLMKKGGKVKSKKLSKKK